MPKLFDVRHPVAEELKTLKGLWIDTFHDSPSVVEHFFEYAVTEQDIVVAIWDGNVASALYMLDSTIANNGKCYKALYIYAVCTHPDYRGRGLMRACFDFLYEVARERGVDYLFLVPAEENLFGMYEKIGFKNGIYYSEKKAFSKELTCEAPPVEKLTFADFINIRSSFSDKLSLATLGERAFNGFLLPESESVGAIKVGNGYAIYEIEDGGVTVHELFGDEKIILKSVFDLTGVESLTVRGFGDERSSIPFGMYKVVGDAPEINNAFFGIPYGG